MDYFILKNRTEWQFHLNKSRHNLNKEFTKHNMMIVCDNLISNKKDVLSFKSYLNYIRRYRNTINSKKWHIIPKWAIEYNDFIKILNNDIYEQGFLSKKKIQIHGNKNINIQGKISGIVLHLKYALGISLGNDDIDLYATFLKYRSNKSLIYAASHKCKNIFVPDMYNEILVFPDYESFKHIESISKIDFKYGKYQNIKFVDLIELFESKFRVSVIDNKNNKLHYVNIMKHINDDGEKGILNKLTEAAGKNKSYFKYYDDYYCFKLSDFKKYQSEIMNYVMDIDVQKVLKILDKAKHINKTIDQSVIKNTQPKLKHDLLEHQQVSVSWLHNLYKNNIPGAILGDDMGLGKTFSAIGFMSSIKFKRCAIIAPASVVGVWQNEIHKFNPLLEKNVDILSYESVRNMTLNDKYDIIILDEGQKVKNPSTLAASMLRNTIAKFKLILTGTPIENSITDLFSLIMIIMPESKRLLQYIHRNNKKDQIGGIKVTKNLINGIYLAREMSKKQLPVDMKRYKQLVTLSKDERSIYDYIIEFYKKELNSINNNTEYYRAAIVALMRLIQAVSDPTQLPTDLIPSSVKSIPISSKMIELQNITKSVFNKNEKIVVFARFTKTIETLSKLYPKALIIKGDVSKSARRDIVEKFQTDDSINIIIISLQAGATGLTLTSANHLAFIDLWWNPAVMEQAARRIYRIGQTKNCNIYYLVANNTIDDSIVKILMNKTELINAMKDVDVNKTTKNNVDELVDDLFK